MAHIVFPKNTKGRGPGFWTNFSNIWESRDKVFRIDYSNKKRKELRARKAGEPLTKNVNDLLSIKSKTSSQAYRFLIVGDTGEGDRSQYATLPLIRGLNPDFMIINGDIAYPAGRLNYSDEENSDYHCGFFKPYRNLGIPIWGTPGNHEYYENEGRYFYDVFCTHIHASLWHKNGLPFSEKTKQPFLYWEIADETNNISFIGLDTGKAANLDGKNTPLQFFAPSKEPDEQQHQWLLEILNYNQSIGRKTIVMFHIPALVNCKIEEKNLTTLHKLIASFSCVKVVIAGHLHNTQKYMPVAWNNFLKDYTGLSFPHNQDYIVSGGGGAALHSTDFKQKNYFCNPLPSAAAWNADASFWAKTKSNLGLEKTWLGNLLSEVIDVFNDPDAGKFLSLLCVDINTDGTNTITPYFIDDIEAICKKYETTDINAEQDSLNQQSLLLCKQDTFSINF